MRFTLMPILLPPAILGSFSFGVHWLMTRGYDRGFAWVLTIGSALACVISIALHVYTVENRLRELEARIDRLKE